MVDREAFLKEVAALARKKAIEGRKRYEDGKECYTASMDEFIRLCVECDEEVADLLEAQYGKVGDNA